MRKGFFILIISILAPHVYGQKADLTSAILSYRKQDFNVAKDYILAAEEKLESGATMKAKDLGKFWYNKGLIFYALYQSENNLDLLISASDAYKKSSEIEGSKDVKRSGDELSRCVNAFSVAAYSSYETKDYATALSLFERVVELNSHSLIGLVDTANLFNATLMAIESGNSEKAIKLSEELISLDPSNGDYHINLIKQLTLIEDTEARFAAVKRGRVAAPDHTGLIFEEVNYYLAVDDNDGLLTSLEIAINAAPDNKVLYFAKGTALGSLKRYEDARNAYEAAIALDANYYDAYNNIASLYLDQTAPLVDRMNDLGLSDADQKKYNTLKNKRNSLYLKAKPFLEEAARIDNTALQVLYALKEVCYQTDDIDCWKRTNASIKELTK